MHLEEKEGREGGFLSLKITTDGTSFILSRKLHGIYFAMLFRYSDGAVFAATQISFFFSYKQLTPVNRLGGIRGRCSA